MCSRTLLRFRSELTPVHRRTFVGSVGLVGSVAVIGYASRELGDTLEIRFWRTKRASGYPAVPTRVREYLRFALDLPCWSVDFSDGGVVPVATEDGGRVTTDGEWPATLLAGYVRRDDVEPASDVNLLVTDGRMDRAPTGYGVPHVASVGGARHIDDLRPIAEQPETVPITSPNFAAQVLIHEVGHALGLGHDHGVAFRRNDDVVATPMLSAYAWHQSREYDRSRCGTNYPDPDVGRELTKKLTYSFSNCARRALREYDGSVVP